MTWALQTLGFSFYLSNPLTIKLNLQANLALDISNGKYTVRSAARIADFSGDGSWNFYEGNASVASITGASSSGEWTGTPLIATIPQIDDHLWRYVFDVSVASNLPYLWYQMENNSYNSGGGYNLDGSLNGTASFNTSIKKYGNYSLLTDPSSSISVPTLYLNGNYGLTIAFWFYRTATGTETFVNFGNGSLTINSFGTSTNYNMYLNLYSSQLLVPFTGINTWNHYAATLTYSSGNTSTWRVYLNGTYNNTTTGTYPLTPFNNNKIGTITGYIDDFRIYNYVLSDANITNIYNNALTNDISATIVGTPSITTATTGTPGQPPTTSVGSLNLPGAASLTNYVQLPQFIPDISSGTTFSFWLYQNSGTAAYSHAFSFGQLAIGANGVVRFGSGASGTSTQFNVYNSSGGSPNILDLTAITNMWVHYTIINDSSNSLWYIYTNGQLTNTTNALPNISNFTYANNFLGRTNFASTPCFTGAIDDFRLYKRALNSNEVSYLYSSITQPIVYNFNLTDVSGTTILNSALSPYNYDGTLVNNAYVANQYDNLYLYYTFDVSSVSGTNVANLASSTYIYDASLTTGSLNTTTYKYGTASLPINSFVTKPSPVIPSNGMSFSVWINTTATNAYVDVFRFYLTSSFYTNVYLTFSGTSNVIYLTIYKNNSLAQQQAVTATVNNAVWNHIVWTISSGGEWKIYVNNSLLNTYTAQQYPITGTYTMAEFGSASYTGGVSVMDDFRMYNKVLSATDVTTLYNIAPFTPGKTFLALNRTPLSTASPYFRFKPVVISQTGFSISMWLLSNAASRGGSRIFDIRDPEISMSFDAAGAARIYVTSGPGNISFGGGSIDDNNWYYITLTVTYGASTTAVYSYYKNGVFVSSITGAYPALGYRTAYNIGTYGNNGTNYTEKLNGGVSNFNFFSRSLSADEVYALYTNSFNSSFVNKLHSRISSSNNKLALPAFGMYPGTNTFRNETGYTIKQNEVVLCPSANMYCSWTCPATASYRIDVSFADYGLRGDGTGFQMFVVNSANTFKQTLFSRTVTTAALTDTSSNYLNIPAGNAVSLVEGDKVFFRTDYSGTGTNDASVLSASIYKISYV